MSLNITNVKDKIAEKIFCGGIIHTMTKENPVVEAVACAEGKIIAAGNLDYVNQFSDDNTETIDLNGKYMFPGFIDAHSTFVLELFKDKYLNIDPVWDLDTILREVRDYCVEQEDEDVIFGYGFNAKELEDYPDLEDWLEMLDEASSEKTIVLLASDGMTLWLNTGASDILDATMEDNDMEYISPVHALSILLDFDVANLAEGFGELAEKWAERGFTSVFNLYSPEYMDQMAMQIIDYRAGESEPVLQRFMTSTYINAQVMPEGVKQLLTAKKAHCKSYDGLLFADFLKLQLLDCDDMDTISPELAEEMCIAVAEAGFNIHIDAYDKPSTRIAYKIYNDIREKGFAENTLVLATDHKPDKDFIDSIEHKDSIVLTRATAFCQESAVKYSNSIAGAIELLTVRAAEITGMSDHIGTIEEGKYADFVIFTENPFQLTLREFSRLESDAIVLDGDIIYDVEFDNLQTLYGAVLGSPM